MGIFNMKSGRFRILSKPNHNNVKPNIQYLSDLKSCIFERYVDLDFMINTSLFITVIARERFIKGHIITILALLLKTAGYINII